MRKICFESNTKYVPFIDVIRHTKDNIKYVNNNNNDCENLEVLIFNIKKALIVVKQDIDYIDKDTLTDYVKYIKESRELISFIMNKSINNIESVIASLPKDNYDSMSKEELIALLREKQ